MQTNSGDSSNMTSARSCQYARNGKFTSQWWWYNSTNLRILFCGYYAQRVRVLRNLFLFWAAIPFSVTRGSVLWNTPALPLNARSCIYYGYLFSVQSFLIHRKHKVSKPLHSIYTHRQMPVSFFDVASGKANRSFGYLIQLTGSQSAKTNAPILT